MVVRSGAPARRHPRQLCEGQGRGRASREGAIDAPSAVAPRIPSPDAVAMETVSPDPHCLEERRGTRGSGINPVVRSRGVARESGEGGGASNAFRVSSLALLPFFAIR